MNETLNSSSVSLPAVRELDMHVKLNTNFYLYHGWDAKNLTVEVFEV